MFFHVLVKGNVFRPLTVLVSEFVPHGEHPVPIINTNYTSVRTSVCEASLTLSDFNPNRNNYVKFNNNS